MEGNSQNIVEEQISKNNIMEESSLKNKKFSTNETNKYTSKNQKNSNFSTSDDLSSKEINPKINRFPYCIVWTPIPFLTYIIPSIGHTGIETSSGVIHDFASSFFISVDDFAFGKPTKYYQLDLNEQEQYEFDRAIEKADNKYNMKEHNLCFNNCHSHVACVLNNIKYKGKNNYTMIHVWWMLITRGKYVSFCGFIKTYFGFLFFAFILWMIFHRR